MDVILVCIFCLEARILLKTAETDVSVKILKSLSDAHPWISLVLHATSKLRKDAVINMDLKVTKMCGLTWAILSFDISLIFLRNGAIILLGLVLEKDKCVSPPLCGNECLRLLRLLGLWPDLVWIVVYLQIPTHLSLRECTHNVRILCLPQTTTGKIKEIGFCSFSFMFCAL